MIVFGKNVYSQEEFEKICFESSSYKEIADKLSIDYNGNNLKKIKKYIEEYQIIFQSKYKTKNDVDKQNQDLINKKIGRLTVLSLDNERNSKTSRTYFLCQCDCENKTILSVRKDALLDKKRPTLSCGCLNKEAAQKQGIKNREDLTGKIFGQITVLSYNEIYSKEYGRPYWNAKCECGNYYVAPSGSLKQSLSCGCLKSRAESKITDILTEKNIPFEREKSFDNLIGQRKLKFDFYLPQHNLLIECQGKQHYEPIEFFGGEAQFKRQSNNDELKRDFCKENNIKLIEIPYWDYSIINEEYLLKLLN